DAVERDAPETDAPRRLERRERGVAQLLRRRRAIAPQVLLEVAGIADERVVGVQLVGLAAEAADGLQPEEEVGFRLRQAPFQLAGGRPLLAERRELLRDRALDLGQGAARRRGGDDLEEAAGLARVLRRRDFSGDALLVDQRAIQARRLSARQ